MLLEKPREEAICADIKQQMQKVTNLNREAERWKNMSKSGLSAVQQIQTECSEGDTSEACVQLGRKRRSIDFGQFEFVDERKSFWDARSFCAKGGMVLTNGTDF